MSHFGHEQWQRCTTMCDHYVIAPQNDPNWTIEKFRAAIAGLAEGATYERQDQPAE